MVFIASFDLIFSKRRIGLSETYLGRCGIRYTVKILKLDKMKFTLQMKLIPTKHPLRIEPPHDMWTWSVEEWHPLHVVWWQPVSPHVFECAVAVGPHGGDPRLLAGVHETAVDPGGHTVHLKMNN